RPHPRPREPDHHRASAAAVGEGRRHRLGLRRSGKPGRLRLHGHTHRAREDHHGGRRGLPRFVVLARRALSSAPPDHPSPRPSRPPRPGPPLPPPLPLPPGLSRRRSNMRRVRFLASAGTGIALLTLAVLLCVTGGRHHVAVAADEPSASDKPTFGDTFVQASIGDITGLIPNITTDGPSHAAGGLIYDGPVQPDKDLNWIASVAESWQFTKDCLTLLFKLRKDVKWHDGKHFTAEDVHFTYKAMMNPKTPTAYREDFELVKGVQVLDPNAVRILYSQPYAKALGSWGT